MPPLALMTSNASTYRQNAPRPTGMLPTCTPSPNNSPVSAPTKSTRRIRAHKSRWRYGRQNLRNYAHQNGSAHRQQRAPITQLGCKKIVRQCNGSARCHSTLQKRTVLIYAGYTLAVKYSALQNSNLFWRLAVMTLTIIYIVT